MRLALSLALAASLTGTAGAHAGETRCWVDRGVLVVPAAFGEVAGDFILDLASPKSVLHVDVALGDGIETPQATAPLRLAGEVRPATLQVASLDARSLGLPSTIVGLIGADALSGYVVDIRFAPCRVRLWRGRAPPFHASATLPLEMADGVPAVPASISDGRTALSGRFAIDTGTAAVRLSSKVAALARAPAKGVDPASRLDPPGRLDALGLAGVAQRRLPAALADDLPPTLTGSIGTAAWLRYEVRIDLAAGRLRLAAPTCGQSVSARRCARSAGSSRRGSR
ncbi:MAG TPA: hypothetical protein VHS81_00420 [Caulobacteraceae bacterium]|nr:hypothetical protein [Caulobacteraceae bacterium]